MAIDNVVSTCIGGTLPFLPLLFRRGSTQVFGHESEGIASSSRDESTMTEPPDSGRTRQPRFLRRDDDMVGNLRSKLVEDGSNHDISRLQFFEPAIHGNKVRGVLALKSLWFVFPPCGIEFTSLSIHHRVDIDAWIARLMSKYLQGVHRYNRAPNGIRERLRSDDANAEAGKRTRTGGHRNQLDIRSSPCKLGERPRNGRSEGSRTSNVRWHDPLHWIGREVVGPQGDRARCARCFQGQNLHSKSATPGQRRHRANGAVKLGFFATLQPLTPRTCPPKLMGCPAMPLLQVSRA